MTLLLKLVQAFFSLCAARLPEEHRILREQYDPQAGSWSDIAQSLPDRTAEMLRRKWRWMHRANEAAAAKKANHPPKKHRITAAASSDLVSIPDIDLPLDVLSRALTEDDEDCQSLDDGMEDESHELDAQWRTRAPRMGRSGDWNRDRGATFDPSSFYFSQPISQVQQPAGSKHGGAALALSSLSSSSL